MNKSELIKAIADEAELSSVAAGRALDSFINTVMKALSTGEQVVMTGFGTFHVKERSARKCRHPHTGEEIFVDATVNPAFKAGKTLKDQVRGALPAKED